MNQQKMIDEIIALDDRRIQALLDSDAQALRSLVHPDLIYTHSSSRQDTFNSYIDGVASGRMKYRSITRSAVRVRPVPCGGVLEGVVDLDITMAGVDQTMRNRFMAFWFLENGAGRLLSWASTRWNPSV
ncbi:Uncharacterised protein [Achromobacter xylosoxidans]|uniref:nuclear transport factor 2 family protein n=1 Tax=Alcaligenes xylosoxydans xylosoxydans TaxID=85698 RepID=UPI0006C2C26B|nr:nuclear transport factor 2 family protein [Achromobacter xylosoxidans]MDX3880723.1 nuclear transport factor 2 family protein [Achromobacter sp.]CUJ39048.1 Uncharacterised protein [Achromobacter xylosoxidans]CUJ50453.1 Uncharacterised protein [Achromobacter xylosoxidans]